jgi:pimeloyl-ACP methyl ester carboxylesterase
VAAIREQALLLGQRKSLVAVLAQDSSVCSGDKPAIVILNSGIIHRVGPNRIFVQLARLLAGAGHLVMRFDLSGIGDSEPRAEGLPPLDAALADIREALDSLQTTRKAERVILVGLCSGADHSIIYGGQDSRVAGVVLIDPAVPRTVGYYLRHYRRRMFRWQSWRNVASTRHPFWKALRHSLTAAPTLAPPSGAQDPVPDLQSPQVRTFLRSAYARTVEAGVPIMAIFSGGREDQHNHPRQLLEAFPGVAFGSQLRLESLGSADHTFSAESHRGRLMQLIVDWVAQQSAPARDIQPTFVGQPPLRS